MNYFSFAYFYHFQQKMHIFGDFVRIQHAFEKNKNIFSYDFIFIFIFCPSIIVLDIILEILKTNFTENIILYSMASG